MQEHPAPRDAGLDAFNALPAAEAAARLLECLAVPRWASLVTGGRPYPDRATLTAAAASAALGTTDGRSGPEILALLNERLLHDWAEERPVVRRELTGIAVRRLEHLLDEPA